MNSSSEQEQIAQLKRNNERLTLLCLIFGAIAIGAGVYARIQHSIARENAQIAAIESKRGAEQKQKAQLSLQEAAQQRKLANELALELAKLKEKSKHAK
jgi:hypothetical protein